MPYTVTVDESAPQTVLQLHREIRADHAGDDIGQGMQALFDLAARTGMTPAGPPSTTYHGDFVPGATTDVDFAVPVSNSRNGAFEGLTVRTTRPGLHARTFHRGDYQSIAAAYGALDRWLRSAPFRPIGPPTEVYLVGPDEAVASKDLLTEIRIPVAPADLSIEVPASVADTVPLLREALASRGFGVLTEIDVSAVLDATIGHHIEDYVVLGACNPTFIAQALDADRTVGVMIPYSVVVRAVGNGSVVEAADPHASMAQLTPSTTLDTLTRQARTGLSDALASLARRIASTDSHTSSR
ncbi:DUF302 domain-containing protein [Nocardia cyriacigeorgica]|uniref:DUF302 domain-containing protein n=1 Tax=Nocardia cyriacigeorgica TaxID=135487 RepID=UPI0018937B8C|nr:DUF302 domain-containing protein [Nocardia cyriacigeorgica]MBF6095603.1 DUF302 domain-containing protein [Nocardia cyriacigeorgica]